MKKILFVIVAVLCMAACSGNQTASKKTINDSTVVDSNACGLTTELEDSIDSVNHIQY